MAASLKGSSLVVRTSGLIVGSQNLNHRKDDVPLRIPRKQVALALESCDSPPAPGSHLSVTSPKSILSSSKNSRTSISPKPKAIVGGFKEGTELWENQRRNR